MFKSVSVKGALAPALAAALSLTVGCETAKPGFTPTGNALVDGRTAMTQAPAKDRVLWQYRAGLAALRQNNYAEAKSMFDGALLTIGNIYGKDKTARKSRNYFNEESKKTFLGEPYERVMAYWYRGILYWMDGEPDNARACFRSGEFQDSDTENKEYSSDYVTLDYLDGFASAKLNADGSDAFKRAQKVSKIGTLPPYNTKANTLVFFEFGQGPTKYASGEYSEQLRIREGRSVVRGAWFKVENKAIRIGPYDDLNFQATTRGGRAMDHILANKAVFKSTTDTIGNAAMIGGGVLALAGRGTSQEVGLGLLAAGVISKIVSATTTPAADTRAWDNLPQYLSFAALELPPGPHQATVQFTDAVGNVMGGMTKTVTFTVPPTGDVVVFVSDHSS